MQPRLVEPVLTACIGLSFLLFGARADAQEKKAGEDIQFETADKVEIHGRYYASPKPKAPGVILLHNIGGNRQQEGWDKLAEALHKDFSVLSFDFRGHGDSTTVNPVFWRTSANGMIKGSARQPSKISYKDFPDAYYPMLVNDIAAAKRFLDQQNDANTCNSSNVVLIGAQEGGAVGALWLFTEWQKQRLIVNNFGIAVPDPQGKLEGEDIAAAIWLSLPRKSRMLGNYDISGWLKGPANKIRDKVPMVFFYGEKDTPASTAAVQLFNELKKTGRDKLELTAEKKKSTNLAGVDLLGKPSLKTEEEISVYLVDKVMPKRGARAWVRRDLDKGQPFDLIPLTRFGFNLR
jgi:pimeloyl-ACP methyl ester carboxylesterase